MSTTHFLQLMMREFRLIIIVICIYDLLLLVIQFAFRGSKFPLATIGSHKYLKCAKLACLICYVLVASSTGFQVGKGAGAKKVTKG